MLPTLTGVEPATTWSPVGQHIQLSHRDLLHSFVKTQLTCVDAQLTWAFADYFPYNELKSIYKYMY